nr:MAG TPA: hypothetical protein [Crassvirales sp.]
MSYFLFRHSSRTFFANFNHRMCDSIWIIYLFYIIIRLIILCFRLCKNIPFTCFRCILC